MSSHVFLCLTPFHCHVAISVAKKSDVVSTSVFIIVTGGAEKSFISPIRRIIKSGVKDDSVIRFGKGEETKALLYFLRFRGGYFYSANIKKLYTRLAIKIMSPSKIITFDDGFGNVSGAGYFYTKDTGLIKKAVLAAAGLPKYECLVSKVSQHYSIYPNLDNVYKVTECISISYFNGGLEERRKLKKKYGVVFIGSPLCESDLINVEVEVEKIEEAVLTFEGRALYLCHPRENQDKLKKLRCRLPFLEIYQHDDIAEAFLIERKDNIDAVVGFFSSALLNVSSEFPKAVYGKKIEVVGGSTIYSKMVESGISLLE